MPQSELQAITGQLYIVNGEPQPAGSIPGLVAQPAPKKVARGREADFLFIHLTLEHSPEGADPLLEELTEALATSFYQTAGSVISAIRRAILNINQQLLAWNVQQSQINGGKTRQGAVACAILQNQELFVVQVGHSLALMGHHFGVKRLSAEVNSPKITPLGRTAGVEFQLTHTRLEPGDMLLLAEPRLVNFANTSFQPILVDTEVEIGLGELKNLIGPGSGRVMLVEFTDEPPLEIPDAAAPIRNLSAKKGFTEVSPKIPLPKRETAEKVARHTTAQAVIGLSMLTGGMADVMGRIKPPNDPEEESLHWSIPAAMAIFIPLLVVIIVTTVYLQRGEVARFNQIEEQMSQSLNMGQQAGSEEESRTYYNQVIMLASQADLIRVGDSDINRMRSEARQALDRLDEITRMSSTLVYSYPAGAKLTAVALGDQQNGDIFVLDGVNNLVLRHLTDENYLFIEDQPVQIFANGQAVQSHIVGKMVDLMWRPKGSAVAADGVAVLDSRGALLSFLPNNNNVRAAPLDLAEQWRTPVQVKRFAERVYVLDPEAGQIWRYYADGEGFTIQAEDPAIQFDPAEDLSEAIDFDINQDDGSVVILFKDGRLRRYANGRAIWTEKELLRDGNFSVPLTRPVALHIVGQGLNSSIFVLDVGSNRLVQISLGGTLLAQYRVTDPNGQELLPQAADFAIAENPFRLFLVVDNQLYLARQEP